MPGQKMSFDHVDHEVLKPNDAASLYCIVRLQNSLVDVSFLRPEMMLLVLGVEILHRPWIVIPFRPFGIPGWLDCRPGHRKIHNWSICRVKFLTVLVLRRRFLILRSYSTIYKNSTYCYFPLRIAMFQMIATFLLVADFSDAKEIPN
jgi:hypothetical protein